MACGGPSSRRPGSGDSPGQAARGGARGLAEDVGSVGDAQVPNRLRQLDWQHQLRMQHVDKSSRNRSVLQMLEVSASLALPEESRFLAVRLFDSALSQGANNDVTVLAAASLLIATKVGDGPRDSLCASICRHYPALRDTDITSAEVSVLELVHWNADLPTAWKFLLRQLKLLQNDPNIAEIARISRAACLAAARSFECSSMRCDVVARGCIDVARAIIAGAYDLDAVSAGDELGEILVSGLREIGSSWCPVPAGEEQRE